MVRRAEEKTLMKIPVLVKRRKGRARSGRRRRQRKFIRKWVWVVRPQFATIIYDLERGRILAIDEGRTDKIAARLLRSLGPEVLAGIQAVCLDMAACYRKAVQRVLPQAKIVFDRFHVKTYVNKAVEEVRKMAQAMADHDDRRFIFNQRWLLLKPKPEAHEQWRLDNLFQLNADLALAYQLKDQFDALYAIRDRAEAEKQLNSYLAYCRRCRLTPFQTLARQLTRWKPYLLNYVEYPISNGMVEGTNNLLKCVLRRGFGYRNMHYYFGKARVATGDLPTMTELGVTVAENRFNLYYS
jgi:transposase